MHATKNPYVVSQDIEILLAQWAEKCGFQIPDDEFFLGLRLDFAHMMSQLFPDFIYLTVDHLRDSLHQIMKQGEIKLLSLDRVYFPSKLNLSLTRTVDENLQNLGISQRNGELPLEQQLSQIMATGVREIALIDDVIFTGGLVSEICKRLKERNVHVPLIYTCIGVGMGVERLESEGMQVLCANYYPQVIDQVCERDFFLGVPSCGRTLIDRSGLAYGVPYMKPFGDPNWASIPKVAQSEYSRFCVKQSIKLWKAIEETSKKSVLCQNLPRYMVGFPINNERFVDLLQRHL